MVSTGKCKIFLPPNQEPAVMVGSFTKQNYMAQTELTYKEMNAVVEDKMRQQRLKNAVEQLILLIEKDKSILKDPQFIEMMKGYGITKND